MVGKPRIFLGLFLGTILSSCLQVGTTTTENALTTTQSPSILTTQKPTTQNPTDTTTIPTTTASQATTQIATFGSTPKVHTTTPVMQLTTSKSPLSETSTSPPVDSTVPPDVPPSSFTVTGTKEALDEPQTQAELCEERSKKLLLICLIVIGVLAFLSVCLLSAVAVMATKLSYVKRRQRSKRLPRTNGDFLSASSLWPSGLETLQRTPSQTTGTAPFRQSLRSENMTPGPGKTGADARKTLERQMHEEMLAKETSIKRPSSTIVNTEI
nr:protein EVI2A [Pogona vitticeps]